MRKCAYCLLHDLIILQCSISVQWLHSKGFVMAHIQETAFRNPLLFLCALMIVHCVRRSVKCLSNKGNRAVKCVVGCAEER